MSNVTTNYDDRFAALRSCRFTPEEPEEREIKKPIYTLDTETDPFKYGRFPRPFVAAVYDGQRYTSFWGDDCIERCHEFLQTLPPGIVYSHNGGKFDFLYFLKYLKNQECLIINRRIVKINLPCRDGKHELRDSLAIFPFALKGYQKDEIDYALMEQGKREKHRSEILEYLRGDCVYLYELCEAFHKRFGPRLTIGGTAMAEIRARHDFQTLSAEDDFAIRGGKDSEGILRQGFYYGGRVQCFKKGTIKGKWKVYDVNSMYPFVMRNYLHPLCAPSWESRKPSKHTCFIVAEGKNYGAFPQRTKAGLTFEVEEGTFHVSIHEWKVALEHGLFEPTRIVKCINFGERGNFRQFVDDFYEGKKAAKLAGDKIHELMYKYVLNSGYGKFAQNPDHYKNYLITDQSEETVINMIEGGWQGGEILEGENDGYFVWERNADDHNRYNVATAASITGAARSVLLDAIARANDPIYCDTDSIICCSLDGVNFSDSELGAWKLEAEADTACIGGKKLYALFSKRECVKQANKGARITAAEIRKVCDGATVEYKRDAPSIGLDGSYRFLTRKVRMT